MRPPSPATTSRPPLFLLTLLLLAPRLTAIPPPPAGARIIAAGDPRFVYEGRFDFADRARPVVIWQASRIRIDFAGDMVALRFADARGQCFFNAEVDGANTVVAVPAGPEARVSLAGLGAGRHHLVLGKRSEAAAGTTGFRGIELPAGAEAWAPAPTPPGLRLEFIGDSITAGACNEDGAKDQWEDRRTHNGALSYAALTAAALRADHRNIAVSGMGVVTGWVPVKAGEVWDRVYPDPSSPRADLAAWVPDIVFVNLGENDGSFPTAHNQPFPAGFTDAYVALVQAIRRGCPSADIVLLRGGMSNGARNEALRRAWTAAVQRLEAADPRAHHFVFTHWTEQHPRVADDRAMADELVAWLRQQSFEHLR